MIEILINGEIVDTNEKTVIAPSFQSSNVAEWKTIQSDYTNTFKLPITQRNKRIFDNINVFNYLSSFNQVAQSCVIRSEGIEIISGFAVLKEKDDYYFSLVVFGGNYNFFAFKDKLNLDQINTSLYDFSMSFANFSNLTQNIEGVVVPYLNYGNLDGTGEVNVESLFHSYYVKTIIKQIFEDSEFEYEGKILTDNLFNNLILPFSNKEYMVTLLETLQENATYLFSQTPTDLDIPVMYQTGMSKTGPVYTISLDLALQIVLDIEFYELTDYIIFKVNSSNTEFQTSQVIAPKSGRFREKFYFKETDLLIGDTFSFSIKSLNNEAFARIKKMRIYTLTSIKETYFNTFPVSLTAKILCNESFPKISQLDFLKEIAKIFGLVFTAKNNVVTFSKIEDILVNTMDNVDLSNKLDLSKDISVEYDYGNYSQVNNFKYNNDETVANEYANHSVLIKNQTLKESNEFIKSFFSSSPTVKTSTGVYCALINYINDNGTEISLNSINNRLLFVEDATALITFKNSYGSSFVSTNYKVAKFISTDYSLLWSDLQRKYYAQLFQSLQDLKVVTCYFDITAIDLNQFDFNKLVYVDYFNAYFYCVKIDKVQNGKSTKFTLLKV